jgi:hypothetical protein
MKSCKKKIVIKWKFNIDDAMEDAYHTALKLFKEDEDYGDENSKFPRDKTELIVRFISCETRGTIKEHNTLYFFSAWLEKENLEF